MEQLVVQVKDEEKAKMLLCLLAALDFVHSVHISHAEAEPESQEEPLDFFALAGQRNNVGINTPAGLASAVIMLHFRPEIALSNGMKGRFGSDRGRFES